MDQIDETPWSKDRRLVTDGYKLLAYLPRGRCAWNATLAALAYSARRRLAGAADLNVWASMHGVAASRRYAELGERRLAFWHGTSAVRAKKIREVGLFHKRGVWAATDPAIAHGYTRGRSRAFGAGSAMVVFVIDKNEWAARAERESGEVARFHESIPRECVEYVLWSDRIEFVGAEKLGSPKPWGAARFKRRSGKWVPRSRPPVRLDGQRSYRTLDEWLAASVERIVTALGSVAAAEVFSSLYATIDPWDALEHRRIFDALHALCGEGRIARGGARAFSARGAHGS